jgi:phage gp29-like protein
MNAMIAAMAELMRSDTVAARAGAEAPIKPSPALTVPQAGPAATWIRDPYGTHPAIGLTPMRLAEILRSSIVNDPVTYLELAEDMEERFPQYSSVMSTRKRQVAALEFTVTPAGEDAADLEEAALVEQIVNSAKFRVSKIDQLDAIAKGFSCTEMNWQVVDGRWLPVAFERRDPRFFRFAHHDPEHIVLKRETGMLEELIPHKWLVHRAKAKSGLTIRGGLARQVAWVFMLQSFNNKDWAIFAESFGMPYRLGKYDQGASIDDKKALLQALVSMGVDGAGIIPLQSEIQFLEAAGKSGSTDLFERRALYHDKQVSKIVLGQTGTTDEMKGGYALGKVHDDVRDDIKDADAEQWAATLNEQLVPQLIGFNFRPRKRTGLPEITIGRPEEEDVKAWTENVARVVPFGVPVSVAEVQKKVGITPPKAGEDVLRTSSSVLTFDNPPPKSPEKKAPVPAALEHGRHDDAIDVLVAELIEGDGWEQLVGDLGIDIAARLEGVQSLEAARAVLADAFAGLDVAALTTKLAQAMFAARLAGEVDEDLQ